MTPAVLLAGSVGGALALTLGGCAINSSPIHTELSPPEMNAAVARALYRGMPGPEVVRQLDRLDLPYSTGPLPPRSLDRASDRGVAAAVRPPGLIGTSYLNRAPQGRLYLWFSLDDRLEWATYSVPPQSLWLVEVQELWAIHLPSNPTVSPESRAPAPLLPSLSEDTPR